MTLNLTLATPQYIIQTSDRRMISVPDGRILNDEANKGLVVKADDGIFSITFAGIGLCNGKRMDMWLAEKLLDNGVPELPVHKGVEILANLATDWFRTFPRMVDKRHTFIIAGWEKQGNDSRAVIWRVENCLSKEGGALESAKDTFDIVRFDIGNSRANLQGSGLVGAFSRDDRRRLEAMVRTKFSPNQAREMLVDIIKRASRDPKWSWGINGNVLAVLLTPSGQVEATHYDSLGKLSRYVPFVLWYRQGRNYVAGDGWCSSSSGLVYQFGDLMFIETPGVKGTKEEVDFMFRFTDAKYKKEQLADKIDIIKAFKIERKGI